MQFPFLKDRLRACEKIKISFKKSTKYIRSHVFKSRQIENPPVPHLQAGS
jgi:hypothetical protein